MRFGLQLRADDPNGSGRRRAGRGARLRHGARGRSRRQRLEPMLCLAAAAAATERIRLGTFVLNASLHNPLLLAGGRDVDRLERRSGRAGARRRTHAGRVRGDRHPASSAAERKARLGDRRDSCGAAGRGDRRRRRRVVRAGWCGHPPGRPGRAVPILVGGSGRRLLAHAGRHADIVGLTGLGRTLPDGHRHAARFQPEVLERRWRPSGRRRRADLSSSTSWSRGSR